MTVISSIYDPVSKPFDFPLLLTYRLQHNAADKIVHRVLRRAQDVVSLPNYGGAEGAEKIE